MFRKLQLLGQVIPDNHQGVGQRDSVNGCMKESYVLHRTGHILPRQKH